MDLFKEYSKKSNDSTVCVCLLLHSSRFLGSPSRRLGYAFGGPPFLPKRSVCNSKGLLRAPRFCVRARLDTLRFRSGELGSDFVVPWSFLESFRVIPCQDSPRGRLWTESGWILGYLGLWPPSPARSPLRRREEAPPRLKATVSATAEDAAGPNATPHASWPCRRCSHSPWLGGGWMVSPAVVAKREV